MTAPKGTLRLELTRVIAAPRPTVFAAWTEPASMKRWFAPPPATTPHAESDPRPGGAYEVHMEGPDGMKYTMRGKYVEIVRDERIVFTWKWDGPGTEETLVTVDLRTVPAGTEVRLLHERFDTEESKARHNEGWEGCLASLTRFLTA